MSIIHCIKIALETLRANKLRSALTMLGIIIGVSAVILMVAILQGLSHRIADQFKKFGSNLIIVAYQPDSSSNKGRVIDGFRMRDVRAIQDECNLVHDVSPEMTVNSANLQHSGLSMQGNAVGVMPDYASLKNVTLSSGRFVSQTDSDTWAQVCVLGSKVASRLYGTTDPIGHELNVNGILLEVVGVAEAKGRSFTGDADTQIFLPLTTLQQRFLGTNTVDSINARPNSMADMNAAKEQIWECLERRYPDVPGIKVDSLDQVLASITSVFAMFTLVLGGIAGLALLVGGIGIMNIMLVSVTERTREIGVRKAIGAKRRDILRQFLIESATLSGVGGLSGVIIGTMGAYVLGYLTTFIPQFADKSGGTKGLAIYVPPWIVIGAFVFSAGVGVFFGMYPAIRASKLDPIQALRTE